jgi:hypothetical protein
MSWNLQREAGSTIFHDKYPPEGTFLTLFSTRIKKNTDFVPEYLSNNNIGVLVMLEYVHALQWPAARRTFTKKYSDPFPLLWGFFYSSDGTSLNCDFHIHPLKCFPTLYIEANSNYNNDRITKECVRISGEDYVLGGCQYNIIQNGIAYPIRAADYCYAFGLPDCCHCQAKISELINYLIQLEEFDIWQFKRPDYSKELENNTKHKYHYFKGEIVPTSDYFFTDNSLNALRGLMPSKERKFFTENLWYEKGREFIRIRNTKLNETESILEEIAILQLRNKLADEFARLFILLINQDRFSMIKSLKAPVIPSYNIGIEDLKESARMVEDTISKLCNDIIREMTKKGKLNISRLSQDRFLVFDVEHIQVSNPLIQSSIQKFVYPAVFSSLIWNGQKKGSKLILNYFVLPCHFCTYACDDRKRGRIRYECIRYSDKFIGNQVTIFQSYLNKYSNFKLYAYGKSDPMQFEYSNIFLWEDKIEFKRKNRIVSKNLSELTTDLNDTGKRLQDIERSILSVEINGWKRPHPHINFNKSFLKIRGESPNWKTGFKHATLACSSDSLSAFLYLVLREYMG